MKTKSSRLLDTIYETSSDLHRCGILTNKEMQEYQEIKVSSPFDIEGINTPVSTQEILEAVSESRQV